jgi:hypothetical protein
MSAERELYERRVHRVSPARAYAIASLLSLAVVAFAHGRLDATVAWWLLLFVFAELARMTVAFAWARQEIERDWLIRIRRIFRVIQQTSGIQVCADGRRWNREQLRGIGVEERVTEHDSYWRVYLLMDDCLILLQEGLRQSAALQECFRLARLLSISEPPYPVGLPARFGAAAVFGLFRLPLVLGLAFQSPLTAWLVALA